MANLVVRKKDRKFVYFLYFLKNSWFVMQWKLFRKKKNVTQFVGEKGITLKLGTNVLANRILSGVPFAAVRFGAVELSCLNNWEKFRLGLKKTFKNSVRYSMKNNAGFFPVNDQSLYNYANLYFKEIIHADVLGISGIHMEDYFYKKYVSQAEIIQYQSFEPLIGEWTYALKGKRVLVVSPFAEEIEQQYARRHEVISSDKVLPKFTLITVKAVQTIGQANDERFESWFEALDYLKMEVVKHEFDIALVGAGAYGTPLCLFIKSQLKKQAIQTGGATQLLFGIMGKRWEKRSLITQFVTDKWIRPINQPSGYKQVEKGCYW